MVTADVSDIHVVGPPPVLIADGVLPFEAAISARSSCSCRPIRAPGGCPGGSGARHEGAHHRAAVAVFESPGTRGFESGSSSGRSSPSTCRRAWLRPPDATFTMSTGASIPRRAAADVWPPDCGSGRGASGRCSRAARWSSPAGSSSAMSEMAALLRDPARNEEAHRRGPRGHSHERGSRVGVSRDEFWLPHTSFEVIVADDGSEDRHAAIVGDSPTPRRATGSCAGGTCAAARNAGVAASSGGCSASSTQTRSFLEYAAGRILERHENEGRCLVLYRLVSREPGIRAWLWWTFWGLARRLPSRAKSMPAFMSCDRAHSTRTAVRRVLVDRRGVAADPAGVTRYHRERFLYDRSLAGRTSSRRMELQPFGYLELPEVGLGGALPVGPHYLDDRIRHHRRPMIRSAIEHPPCLPSAWYRALLRAGKYSVAWIVDDAGVHHLV